MSYSSEGAGSEQDNALVPWKDSMQQDEVKVGLKVLFSITKLL